jgi:caffeoyl-CoA O-methyltransferase
MNNFILKESMGQYLDNLLPQRDAVLAEMESRALREDIPILGPACARLLVLLVQISGARRIFELGSAIGYTTIWLARAAGPQGEIHYTDNDPTRVRAAQEYFRRAGVNRRIRVHQGEAVSMLKQSKGKFDFVFCDLDKEQYPAALRAALPRLRRGGLFVADNVLRSGLVSKPGTDSATRAIQKLNRMIYSSSDLFSVIVPLRDGVSVSRKS